MKRILIYIALGVVIFGYSACYNNKKDVTLSTANSLASISFRDDVVPIVASGACGCHNNGLASNAVQFSIKDTIYYGNILALQYLQVWQMAVAILVKVVSFLHHHNLPL